MKPGDRVRVRDNPWPMPDADCPVCKSGKPCVGMAGVVDRVLGDGDWDDVVVRIDGIGPVWLHRFDLEVVS